MADKNKVDGSSKKAVPPKTGSARNAWLVCLGEEARDWCFRVTINSGSPLFVGAEEGDGVLVVGGDPLVVVSFARIYRIRSKLNETTFFFDSVLPVDGKRKLSDLGVAIPETKAAMLQLEWLLFEAALKTSCGIAFDALPTLEGKSDEERDYLRELLQLAVVDDLLGPADGSVEEIMGMSVRDRYLVGKLSPMSPKSGQPTVLPFAEEGVRDSEVPSVLTPNVNNNCVSRDKVANTAINDGEDKEVNATNSQSLVPSSIGFTFCVNEELENIQLFANWGRYERTLSKQKNKETNKFQRCWKRIPSGGSAVVSLKKQTINSFRVDADCPSVVVRGSVSTPLENGDRLVTLFLVNYQTIPKRNQDQAWIFQPELIVKDMGGRAVFRRRPTLRADEFDEERKALEMIYRNRVEFAVGHGVSIHAVVSEKDNKRATEVRTTVLPEHEIQMTEAPGLKPEDRPAMCHMIEDRLLDMERLADLERNELVAGLKVLTDDYAKWIAENQSTIGKEVVGYNIPATKAMKRCLQVLYRLEEGIEVLRTDDRALAAFRFANRAMATQRIHSIYALARRRGDEATIEKFNVRKNRSWHPFQLAFMLLSIPALADPTHRDRTQPLEAFADLLWFPTGGGKTEAYLGVAAFTMGIRRLQGSKGDLDSRRGVAVIMRYTLRLLTLQQFQRATALICAMEVLRRAKPAVWGEAPFTIGLWIGQSATPNTTKASHDVIKNVQDGKYGTGSTPAQLTSCPWCGSEIAPARDIRVDMDLGRTFVYCGDKHSCCEFSKTKSKNLGLPILVVDDEIYRHPPSILIATVDKFAMMAWRGQVRTLFGKVRRECPRHGLLWPEAGCNGNHNKKGNLEAVKVKEVTPIQPPDLIIQDEFHLISGSLGTMVGLYETAVDELSTWTIDGKAIRPKVIASTATVRKAEEQVNNVFLRRVSVFPPHGLNIKDNFFSVQRSVEVKPGRLYMGICSPGSSRPAVSIRVYVALLTAAQSLFNRFGTAADPYMTVVGYFNSLRELGSMRRLADDDVHTRAYRVQMGNVKRPGLSQRSVRIVDELTSRVSNKEIPKKLDQLEVKFKSTREKGEPRAIDIVLATNMLSVGIDIKRIGLMVVNGQPKNTAEYIQATSRIGRSFPGLVCTVLTWSRPRDLSHYETFEHYHATFYKHVEAQSVTPFSARALDRGLTGTMVSLLRLENDSMNPNPGAQSLDSYSKDEAIKARKVLSERAWKVKNEAAGTTAYNMTARRIDRWVKESVKTGRKLGYETRRGQGDLAALLKKAGTMEWDEFTVPMSMREVEPEVRLSMDASKYTSESPSWKPKIKKENGGAA